MSPAARRTVRRRRATNPPQLPSFVSSQLEDINYVGSCSGSWHSLHPASAICSCSSVPQIAFALQSRAEVQRLGVLGLGKSILRGIDFGIDVHFLDRHFQAVNAVVRTQNDFSGIGQANALGVRVLLF